MKEQFVPYEIALKIRERGFNATCLALYNTAVMYDSRAHQPGEWFQISKTQIDQYNHLSFVKAPLWQQAMDWFREEKGLVIDVHLHDRENPNSWKYEITEYGAYEMLANENPYMSYHETRELAILRALEIVDARDETVTDTPRVIDNTSQETEWSREDLIRIWNASRAEIGGRRCFRGGPEPVIKQLVRWKSIDGPEPFWAWAFEPQGAYERLIKENELAGTITRVEFQPEATGQEPAGLNGIVDY